MLCDFLSVKHSLEDCLKDTNLMLHMRALGYNLIPEQPLCTVYNPVNHQDCGHQGKWFKQSYIHVFCDRHKDAIDSISDAYAWKRISSLPGFKLQIRDSADEPLPITLVDLKQFFR